MAKLFKITVESVIDGQEQLHVAEANATYHRCTELISGFIREKRTEAKSLEKINIEITLQTPQN